MAKERVRQGIKKINFKDKEQKKLIENWIANPEVIFGPEDVETYLEQIRLNQADAEDKNNN
ncbi:hypothetical protein [Candidatus Magnetobacterium casense]|uniref:Uncharacterized protein n=1 Tax=Candidatus Magnetobacterium casense TaxID=1455061 RepID=A0ABS6RV13_9BACT|nr:hypothetical protein [Candidatus Magnetobacterium casensis]MBV6340118.1 hypothetical protein [Candidatus Magnetobacterium casensis]